MDEPLAASIYSNVFEFDLLALQTSPKKKKRHCWIHLHVQKNNNKKKIPMSVHCELRHVPKVLSKKITKLSGRQLNQVKAKWIKPENGTLHFLAALSCGFNRWEDRWCGEQSVLKRSAFKSQLKDFCFCRRSPHLAAELREKQHGSTLMFSWKF